MEKERLDLNAPYVVVGPFAIQGRNFFGLPPEADRDEGEDFASHWRGRLKFIAAQTGCLYDEALSGVQQGYGHGYRTLTLANKDGSLVFQMEYVNHCDGPGYSCSYSHGPWYKYGKYNKGEAEPDPDLIQALELKQKLQQKFRF